MFFVTRGEACRMSRFYMRSASISRGYIGNLNSLLHLCAIEGDRKLAVGISTTQGRLIRKL